MDGKERDEDYEYGYDYLYEEEQPADATEGADERDEELYWNDLEKYEEQELATVRAADVAEGDDSYWQDDETVDESAAPPFMEADTTAPPPAATEPENAAERERKKLKRELKAEALARFEEASRTETDFRRVVQMWDKLDQTRERRERYNEILEEDAALDYGKNGEGLIFPKWMMEPMTRQLSRGNFVDYLADCPYEMHDLTDKAYLRKIIAGMKVEHKELFYFLYLHQYSPQRLACLRGQTDRNIRKVRDVVLRKVRRKVYDELKRLDARGYHMTGQEREFFGSYTEQEAGNDEESL